MCGIAGLLSLNGGRVCGDTLTRMTNAIAHRGPDDSGYYMSHDHAVGLGSRRLSILDLSSAGRMPMSSEDGRIWVVFNGEIYNFQALRRDLVGRGHAFRSTTDTEVIVHLYEERGISFLDDLDGMFAIAIWDVDRQTLLLARDRLGEKPVYFSDAGGTLRFASEIKSVLQDPGVPRELDLESLNQYLTFGFVMPPRTMFRGISKLAPGERILFHRTGSRDRARFWTPLQNRSDSQQQLLSLPFEEHVRIVRAELERSIEACMVADVPVGAFLSGGVDSSAVVSIMSRRLGRKVESVTVSYPDDACDESAYASEVAEHAGASINMVTIRPTDAEDAFSECVYHMDEPVADPACINTFFAARRLRTMGVPVALVGEGADELFLGYPSYLKYLHMERLWRVGRTVPEVLRRATFRAVAPLLGPLGWAHRRDFLQRAAAGDPLFVSTDPCFLDYDKALVAGARLSQTVRTQRSAHLTASVQRQGGQPPPTDLLSLISLAEARMRMPEQLLMRVDKQSMAHSVEVRAPFLNWRLADYALALPGSIRAAAASPKALLKFAVRDLIPERALTRPKMGFGTAVRQWCDTWAGSLLERRLRSSDLFTSEVLSAGEAMRLIREHRTHAQNHHPKIWNLLCLTEWAERYGISIPSPGSKNEDGRPQ